MNNKEILQVRNLTTRIRLGDNSYKIVDSLSFSLKQGKTLAIVGESGSGKTITALSILRIFPTPPFLPPEGELIYEGRNLLALSEKEMRSIRGSKIAMIFQDPMSALNPVFTIGSQLIEVCELHLNLYGDEAKNRALQLLYEVGIPSPETRFNDYPHQMSGGMKQRVMIAMALICEPDILIADEPTTALDVTIQAQILRLIKELQARRGTALVLITHDMGIVAEMADEVIVMYATQAVEVGSVHSIFEKMSHPYTQGLFQSRPDLDKPKAPLQPIKGSVPSINNLPKGCHFNTRCPYAMPICFEGEVPYFAIEDKTHQSKCWLHEHGGPSNLMDGHL
jgi:oligopeptide/dipeptide ABC transporter ATP-binding protein